MAMNLEQVAAAETLWVWLGEDDMYGAESGTDPIVQCRVSAIYPNYPDVDLEDVDSDDQFDHCELHQLFATEQEARAAFAKAQGATDAR